VKTVRPVMGKNGGKDIPVVGRGKGEVKELQCEARKLGVQTIEVGDGQEQGSHAEQKAAAMANTGSSSGSRCSALGN
jgi:hypothetical protein